MSFIHNGYGIEVDFDSLEFKVNINKLKSDVYRKIPKTKCIQCPGKEGVEADCCKTFSPPMLLIEFVHIMRLLEKRTKEERGYLYFECFKSFLEPGHIEPCPLLDNEGMCSVYEARPFSCRMFGQYDEDEWDERLENVSIELGMEKEKVPFYKQCEGVELKKKQKIKKITKESSDHIFRKIYDLDIELFPKEVRQQARDVVMGSYTYLPFDAHYLLMTIGQEKLEDLTSMKIKSRQLKREDPLLYMKHKKEIEDFLKVIKEGLKCPQ